jgi:hypothetical protein
MTKAIFFLVCNSDQRKLVADLEKKSFWGASLEWKAGLATDEKINTLYILYVFCL